MQGTVILRALGVAAFAVLISGCHFNSRTAAGETPPPSATSAAQANSTAAPDQGVSQGPADKFVAKTNSGLHGVNFSIWANGRPAGAIQWPGKALDITQDMRGHANTLVVEWTRTQKNGSGTLTIATSANKTIFTTIVTPSSPEKGRNTKTFIAPQSPIGRPPAGG